MGSLQGWYDTLGPGDRLLLLSWTEEQLLGLHFAVDPAQLEEIAMSRTGETCEGGLGERRGELPDPVLGVAERDRDVQG